jgi:glycosyltransferase involved in cell wall biosynthesis
VRAWFAAPEAKGLICKNAANELREAMRDDHAGSCIETLEDHGAWRIPAGVRHIYFRGNPFPLTVGMLQEAARSGVATVSVSICGFWINLNLRRIAQLRNSFRLGRLQLRLVSTEEFAALISNAPKLPACKKGRIIYAASNLSPGGSERQTLNTLSGVAQVTEFEPMLLCDMLTPNHPDRFDFYLQDVKKLGVPVDVVQHHVTDLHAQRDNATPEILKDWTRRIPFDLGVDIANWYIALNELQPEIVHAWLDRSNIPVGIAAALSGVPKIILSGRNLNPSRFELYRPYMRHAYQALLSLDRVVLLNNSEAGALDYSKWLGVPKQRISVIRNGLMMSDLGEISDDQITAYRHAAGLPTDGHLVSGMFRLQSEKRPQLWLKVAREICKVRKDVYFRLYGDGALRRRCERLIKRYGLTDRVALVGVEADVMLALASADALLLTSSAEGTPNVVLEAQWQGTPVVATASGGTGETLAPELEDFLIKSNDPAAIAGKVIEHLDTAAARNARIASYRPFLEARFGFDRMIRETIEMYKLGDSEFPNRDIH